MIRAVSLLVLALLLAAPGRASAHANLERSTPAAGTVVVELPRQAVLWFSEEPELRLTELRLLDPRGTELAALPPRPAPGEPRAVLANLPQIQPGTYVITWRTTSAVDGHTTRGAITFTYGAGQVPEAVEIPGVGQRALYTPTPLNVLARFLGFVGAFGVAGGLAFHLLVLRRALAQPSGERRRRSEAEAGRQALERAGRRALALIGGVGLAALLLGTILAAIGQAAEAADVSPLAALGEPLSRAIVGTRYGYLFGARLTCVVGLALLWPILLRSGRPEPRIAALLLAGGVLLTFSLGAHAAAVPILTPLVVALDWVHLSAASAWVGGLALLTLTIAGASRQPGSGSSIATLIGGFSVMAPIVGVVIATGLVQAAIQVGGVGALLGTPYGQTLLFKMALVGGMALLGLLHWQVVGPRLQGRLAGVRAAVGARLEGLARRFRWTTGIEALLGVAVLLVSAGLTAQQPARDQAVALRSVVAHATADDLEFRLEIAPGEAGPNRIELQVRGDVSAVQRVVLRIRHLDMAMGEAEVELRPIAEGVYGTQTGQLSMAGRWEIEPLVRRAGRADARAPMEVPIAEPLVARAEAARPFELTTPMIIGLELAIFGAILAIASRRLTGRSRRAATAALGGGIAVVIFGAYVTAMAIAAETATPARLQNPLTLSTENLAAGRELYELHCATCHGITGRGDGPLGRSLNPRPADLRAHVYEHPEGQLFQWIRDGIPGTAMPAFGGVLSEQERWQIVGFIRGFAADGPPPAQTAVSEMVRGVRGGP